jgi:hypothetical protein
VTARSAAEIREARGEEWYKPRKRRSALHTGRRDVKTVERSEILDIASYEGIREHFRRRIIELKRARRVGIGSNVTMLFENHDSVLYQVQEMLRTERITREDAIFHELETYNDLIPGPSELSATVFLEYPEREERERMLVELAGIENKFYLEIGGEKVFARNETRGVLPDRTTAVHYTKFSLPESACAALSARKPSVFAGVDHPSYRAKTELVPRSVDELKADLDIV